MSEGLLDSPIGWLLVRGTATCIRAIDLLDYPRQPVANPIGEVARAVAQLREYFQGQRKDFDFCIAPQGTAFQTEVWKLLLEIPFGATTTYGTLARRLGDEKRSRAVGAANGRNPIAVAVPCHRVIGCSGSLTGYAGGLERKSWLLQWEASQVPAMQGDLFAENV